MVTEGSPARGVHAAARRTTISANVRNRSTDPVIHPTKLEDGTPVRAGSTDPARGGRPDPAVAPPNPSPTPRLPPPLDVPRLVRAGTDPNPLLKRSPPPIPTAP